MIVKKIIFLIILFPVLLIGQSKTLHVGTDQPYPTLQSAAQVAIAGDIVMIHNGTYKMRENITKLNGETENPIIIFAEEEGKVIYSGQSEAWHLSSCSNIYIYGFIFENQTGNGVNIDDGGNYDGSANNITIKNCIFRDMNATGNNDLLKLSGLNDFTIEKCNFLNGSEGGSGIDMVGCHNGTFTQNHFENMGSNCIQIKGGSQYISIHQNKFVNGGQRSINIGGNTGLEFFRPSDARFESADIDIYSNIFVGSWSPVAFVGTIRSKVFNNTFYKPENWVFRILQETVDTNRFYPCGQNEFSNNIIYFGNSLHSIVNIGPNTEPESFIFSNNLWYNYEDKNFTDPHLPVPETNPIIQQDPMFFDHENMNFEIDNQSPAISGGKEFNGVLDFNLRYFSDNICIGAFQTNGIYKDFTGDIGTNWIYDDNGKYNYRLLTIADKLIEDDKEYSLITEYFGGNDEIIPRYKFFTSDGKFYFMDIQDNLNNEIDSFHLFYDYNLKQGDYIEINDPYNNSTYGCGISIDSVRFINLAGAVRKIIGGYDSVWEFIDFGRVLNVGQPAKIIEGIHSVNSYIFGNSVFIFGDNMGNYSNCCDLLRCFSYPDKSNEMITVHFTDYECKKSIGTMEIPDYEFIFPNPVHDFINFQFRFEFTGDIDIYDISGKKLSNYPFSSQKLCSIDVSSLKTGFYFAKVHNTDINFTKKFIVMK